MIAIAVGAIAIVFFAVSSWRAPVAKVETPSVVVRAADEDTSALLPDQVTAQLKVEFLSDLHKNIETTKAHAPLY